jgi:hypothetical protein
MPYCYYNSSSYTTFILFTEKVAVKNLQPHPSGQSKCQKSSSGETYRYYSNSLCVEETAEILKLWHSPIIDMHPREQKKKKKKKKREINRSYIKHNYVFFLPDIV